MSNLEQAYTPPRRRRKLQELGQLLSHATMMEPDDLAKDVWWQDEARRHLARRPTATIDEQRFDLAADMRELVRIAATDRALFETSWWVRRAHRALCQADGVIGPGEDFIRQFRLKTADGWSDWQLLTECSWKKTANVPTQVRYAPAGRAFRDWTPPPQTQPPVLLEEKRRS
jgi:hypothetical protein